VLHVTKSEHQMMRKDNTTGRRSREAIFHKDIMFSSLMDSVISGGYLQFAGVDFGSLQAAATLVVGVVDANQPHYFFNFPSARCCQQSYWYRAEVAEAMH
jgi:hypothetical protein